MSISPSGTEFYLAAAVFPVEFRLMPAVTHPSTGSQETAKSEAGPAKQVNEEATRTQMCSEERATPDLKCASSSLDLHSKYWII
jgi:hypothetical protein